MNYNSYTIQILRDDIKEKKAICSLFQAILHIKG